MRTSSDKITAARVGVHSAAAEAGTDSFYCTANNSVSLLRRKVGWIYVLPKRYGSTHYFAVAIEAGSGRIVNIGLDIRNFRVSLLVPKIFACCATVIKKGSTVVETIEASWRWFDRPFYFFFSSLLSWFLPSICYYRRVREGNNGTTAG